ncbi:hypothetical protein PVK06_035292 [Gossypium arboreum]|uniref:Uncharacterized protein n=1 Tax=Gossypium arboreum TaxID=29729 RepID=A0ABR0NHK8_GOSAR|nr:hypothetical protein PVK06_035292 [Gossypium arboreum]
MNFREAGQLSWGSTVLSKFYRDVSGDETTKLKLVVACYYCNNRCGETMGKLCGTTGGARRYAATFRSMIESGVQFELTPDSGLRIQAYIPSEILVNPNMWHVKVPLVVYTMVEMHESDQVMQ